MRVWGIFAGLLVLALPVFANEIKGTVDYVFDGDSFVLKSGQEVRLLDINTPEGPHHGQNAEPMADVARANLVKMIGGKELVLRSQGRQFDKYGRLLAYAYLPDGTWVNLKQIQDGLAVVYTFDDHGFEAEKLLAAEQAARSAKKGIWALPRWSVREAKSCCGEPDFGKFNLIEGKIVSSAYANGGTWYFNFGDDYRTDFSLEVRKRDLKNFKKAGIKDIAAFYEGKTVRVHGVVRPVNGALVRVTHPAQVEILK